MKRMHWLTALALCLSIFTATLPGFAQADRDTGDAALQKMEREGWKILKEGVLKRELRSNETETYVYGVEGFTWKLEDLRSQLQKLRAALQAQPTPELRKAIANHRQEIANTLEAVERARVAEANGEIGIPKNTCGLNFSYNADGGPKTDVQGIWASASASFTGTGPCGFSGEVYAYALAKTYVSGAYTTETVSDGPRSGASVSASAFASRNGGSPCETSSYASVTSYNLNPSSYSKSKQTYNCALPLRVDVTVSPSYMYLSNGSCQWVTWTVNISGGTPSYTSNLYLNGYHIGTGTSHSEYFCGGYGNYTEYYTLRADVTDSASATASDQDTVTVQHEYYYGGCNPYQYPYYEYCPLQ